MLRMIENPPGKKSEPRRDCGAHYTCVVGLRLGAVGKAVERDVTETVKWRRAARRMTGARQRRAEVLRSGRPVRHLDMRRRSRSRGRPHRDDNHSPITTRQWNSRQRDDDAVSADRAWDTTQLIVTICSRTWERQSWKTAARVSQAVRSRAATRCPSGSEMPLVPTVCRSLGIGYWYSGDVITTGQNLGLCKRPRPPHGTV